MNKINKNLKIKSYRSDFKFKVALELIRGDLTLAKIISKYQVPRSVACRWKKQLLDNGDEVFKSSNPRALFCLMKLS